MGLVLCATRGGQESIVTQERAISLAKEQDDPLVFLYVADSSFLDKTAAAVVVDAVVRAGSFVPTFIEVAHELGATSIVLGRPGGETGRFNEEEFSAFCVYLREQTGAEIITP
jgi:hypothetical protein